MAKFFVGQRVKKVRHSRHDNGYRVIEVGCCGVIVRASDWWYIGPEKVDWLVKYDGCPLECGAMSYMLEPITDTWAQDKVAQLVKQCMPVAA